MELCPSRRSKLDYQEKIIITSNLTVFCAKIELILTILSVLFQFSKRHGMIMMTFLTDRNETRKRDLLLTLEALCHLSHSTTTLFHRITILKVVMTSQQQFYNWLLLFKSSQLFHSTKNNLQKNQRDFQRYYESWSNTRKSRSMQHN
jgi:hypothetical protein